jgi:hypothetical protein
MAVERPPTNEEIFDIRNRIKTWAEDTEQGLCRHGITQIKILIAILFI